jgi:aspartate carbamoyltransferase regulatory subunit
MRKLIFSLILFINSSCIPQHLVEHKHHIINVDTTTYKYHLIWYCEYCNKWLETKELHKIHYTF